MMTLYSVFFIVKLQEMIFINRNYKVYKHTSPSNKVYIGITKQNVNKRWLNGKGYKHNEYFTNAINKYGWDNFKHEILFDNLTKEEAKLMEQMYIALYDSTNRNKGYNIELGGGIVSDETSKKISDAISGEKNGMYGKNGELNPMYGRTWWDENTPQEKIEQWKDNIGKSVSGENNGFYGKNWDEYGGHPKGMLGKEHTEAWKEEHSKRMTGDNNPFSRRVRNIDTNEIFPTMEEARKKYNLKSSSAICDAIKKGTKCRGCHWEYIDENTENNQEAS